MQKPDVGTTLTGYLSALGANEGYGEELWRLYRANAAAVPADWRAVFERLSGEAGSGNGRPGPAPAQSSAGPAGLQPGDSVEPLRGAAARLAANMEASLSIPTATSQRSIPVAKLEANRQRLNQALAARQQKLSFTPLLAWALVQAARDFPALNNAYGEAEGQPVRIARAHLNLGLAVDVERAGGRSLLVPVVKQADEMDFGRFYQECDRLVRAARSGKLSPDDLSGATLSLTNPGTLGTRASVPRLMAGQAAIIAAGALAYPAGFEAVPEATLQILGVGKTLTLTCTYDHRVVQGAESGAYLARVQALLEGADGFYEGIYASLGVEEAPAPARAAALSSGTADPAALRKQAAVSQLAHMYRVRGHLRAAVDPLELRPLPAQPELELHHYGLGEDDLERPFLCPLAGRPKGAECTLQEILNVLQATYCGHLALEYMHLQRPEERRWLQERMEPQRGRYAITPEQRQRILRKLTEAEEFEHLLHARFVGHKRFSLEGGEALIAALDHLLNLGAESEVEQVVLGMAHRGRLNVLVTVLGVKMAEMFSKFEDVDPDSVEGSGDVKYHVGAEGEHTGANGRRVAIEMISNPSHLEAVDPVVEGSTRARQDLLHDGLRARVLPVLMHGDAAFAGQGVVAETLNLSQLGGYRTGGTVHLVVNNQIGFTTSPAGARSSLYCTDVARTVQAPIFHVNGDDPEAVVWAVGLAFAFRRQFNKDVVLDLVCYRRHGHNEADDPSLTAPVLYRKIDSHPSVRKLYQETLIKAGVLASAEAAEQARQGVREQLSQAAAQPLAPQAAAEPSAQRAPESVSEATLQSIGERLTALPEGFQLHPKLKTFNQRRLDAVHGQGAVDWSLAEALALGSLALEATPVRLSGQDTGRGTFSQRHAVLYDYENGSPYIPLAHLSADQQPVEIYDSLLSEEAAVGFEFGYAVTHPSALVIWEAQFGDFVNGAQVMIDQFLSASEKKWGRSCGLCLLLPHGYEGQGPEHSSARLERFLQLSADSNWRVANCTTAAQYFHLLRSQGQRRPRRPLIVFTPKSLLRHPEVASPLGQLTQGGFQPLLDDADVEAGEVKRILACSGKIYYDLKKGRPENAGAAMIRFEQLYPFPEAELQALWKRYPKARELRWVQEEPQNMGAWSYTAPLFRAALPETAKLTAVTRPASSSPATGSLRRHQQEQGALVQRAWTE